MLKDWISAARPRTLPVSAGPVIAATAFAWHNQNFRWVPALLCLMFALLAQIASNLANDYFDFKKGSDKIGRVGPAVQSYREIFLPEPCSSATLITLGTACLFGCGLIWYTGWLAYSGRYSYRIICTCLHSRPLSSFLSRIRRYNRICFLRTRCSKPYLLCASTDIRYGRISIKYSHRITVGQCTYREQLPGYGRRQRRS